jgi:hypothetical protein
MSSINYDPDGVPEIDQSIIADARAMGMQIVQVCCDEPEAKVGDTGAVSFFAVTPFLPQIGERLILEDENICQVIHVYHKVYTRPGGMVRLIPTVDAVLLKNSPAE